MTRISAEDNLKGVKKNIKNINYGKGMYTQTYNKWRTE